MADGLQVELVSADRLVWSGEATMVRAKTAEGDIGILKDHAPVLSVMRAAPVEIETSGETVVAAVDDGFLSVAANRVSILTEHAELAADVDASAARAELDRLSGSDADDEEAQAAIRAAEARVAVSERS
ncbi:F0F1 ATP synthase subunit epsilon [Nocardioides mangrovicus]|uniref:ATP synthase epsilon chain n=1 Tax=Nocardioides mangrovicus TaxID=2478913 RepID=A0A3L8P7U4_9ACTN|nr:F0F1 ATP synthase subunit epsilon [Nocardioides mangrovicus]RLV51037.1 F0F1 ATP synthase subunit epsilon [Nocardioides mangrovicus]